MLYLFTLLIGVVSGLRTVTAPAAVSWAAYLGWLPLKNGPLGFLAASVTPYILTLLAVGELIRRQVAADAEPQGAGRI
jgi:uncharacterized membrane protein